MSLAGAQQALTAGDLLSAETAARQLLAQEPSNVPGLHFLGTVLIHQARFEEAAAALAQVAALAPSPEVLGLLAQTHYRTYAFAASEAALDRMVNEFPAAVAVAQFQQLAKLKSAAGKPDEARAVFARAKALHPDNLELMINYADTFADTPERACAELEACLARVNTPQETSHLLRCITAYRARHIRARLGPMASFAQSWQETCRWPDAEGIERLRKSLLAEITGGGSARGGAYLDLACVAMWAGNWQGAEQLLAHVRNGMAGTFADCLVLNPHFHTALETLSDAAHFAGLAPVQYLVQPPFQTGETIFLGADPNYFRRFILPFLGAMDAAGVAADIQVHLLDGTPPVWAEAARDLEKFTALRVGLSAEASGAADEGLTPARIYYHSVRFIRLYQEVARTRRPVWMLDADVNFVRDPRPLLASIAGHDIALRTNPYCFEPNAKIMGGCLAIAPTKRGLAFARRVAVYIGDAKNRGKWTWGIDQLALFLAYVRMCELKQEPGTLFLGPDAAGGLGETACTFQFPAGIQKFMQSAPAA